MLSCEPSTYRGAPKIFRAVGRELCRIIRHLGSGNQVAAANGERSAWLTRIAARAGDWLLELRES